MRRVAGAAPLAITVDRAQGDKCERCWKYTLDVGQDLDFPTICLSCAAAVREILRDREATGLVVTGKS